MIVYVQLEENFAARLNELTTEALFVYIFSEKVDLFGILQNILEWEQMDLLVLTAL